MLLERDGMMRQFKENLSVAQRRIETTANPKCRVVAFLLGDWVLVKLQPYRKTTVANRLSNKFSKSYYSLFVITERIGKVSYRLALPATSRIQSVFHVSVLKPYKGSENDKVVPLSKEFKSGGPIERSLAICAS